jgi:hypothetical protein
MWNYDKGFEHVYLFVGFFPTLFLPCGDFQQQS